VFSAIFLEYFMNSFISFWKPRDMTHVASQQNSFAGLVFAAALVSLYVPGVTGLVLACICALAAVAVLVRYDMLIDTATGGKSMPFRLTVIALGLSWCLGSLVPFDAQPNPSEVLRIVMLTLSVMSLAFVGMLFGGRILSKNLLAKQLSSIPA
jgi:hypothetical protein